METKYQQAQKDPDVRFHHVVSVRVAIEGKHEGEGKGGRRRRWEQIQAIHRPFQ